MRQRKIPITEAGTTQQKTTAQQQSPQTITFTKRADNLSFLTTIQHLPKGMFLRG